MQRIIEIFFVLLIASNAVFAQAPGEQQIFESQSAVEEEEEVTLDIIYPNPTFGILNFDLRKYLEELDGVPYFKVVIRNVIAKEIFSSVFERITFKQDFSFLDKGTYLISAEDRAGKKLFARRLVIITP